MPRALPVAMTSSTIKWLEFKVSSGEKGKKKLIQCIIWKAMWYSHYSVP